MVLPKQSSLIQSGHEKGQLTNSIVDKRDLGWRHSPQWAWSQDNQAHGGAGSARWEHGHQERSKGAAAPLKDMGLLVCTKLPGREVRWGKGRAQSLHNVISLSLSKLLCHPQNSLTQCPSKAKLGCLLCDATPPRTQGTRYAAPVKTKVKVSHPGLQQGCHHLGKAVTSTQRSWVETKDGTTASFSVDLAPSDSSLR